MLCTSNRALFHLEGNQKGKVIHFRHSLCVLNIANRLCGKNVPVHI